MDNNKKPNYYVFTDAGKTYIFDYINIYYMEISQEISERFTKASKAIEEESIDSCEDTLIKRMYDSDIFFSNRKLQYSENRDMAFITMAPVHACNLACKYCFADHGENYKSDVRIMGDAELGRALEYIYFDYFSDVSVFRFDFVSGGEPLLHFSSVKNVVDICSSYKERGKHTNFWLCTNGTIDNDDYFRFLNDNNFNIGISLDGNERDNLYRVFPNGDASYRVVSNTVSHIMGSSVYTRNFKNIWGLVVITADTESLIKIMEHHKKLGFGKVQMRVVRTKEAYGLNGKTINKYMYLYEELINALYEEFRAGKTEYAEMLLNDNDYFGKILRRLILRRVVTHRCQAGKNKVSLSADGSLYPCDAFVGIADYNMGNALRRECKKNELSSMNLELNKKCSECWARYVCGGDCYHNSYIMCDDIYETDESFCKLQKYLIEKSIVLLCLMNESNEELFGDLARKVKISTREGIN